MSEGYTSYMDGYKESLEKCFSKAREEFFQCDRECSQDRSKHDWSVEKLHGCFDRCDKALNNSGCIKVSEHHDCHRWCEGEYRGLIGRSLCKRDCNAKYAFSDTNNTPEDISYYSADLFSVL
ncbi:MAG: hypothetical protein ACR5LA_03990 [Wolbachia sp.]